MKKKLLNACKYISLAGACFLLTPAISSANQYVSVIKDGVNIRTGPSTNDPVYMELFQDYPLEVIEKEGDWLKIRDYEKDTGWVYASLVSDKKTAIVSSNSRVNMRSGPSTKHDKVASLEPGVVLSFLDQEGDWVHVKHAQGTEGWIHTNLLWPW